jgi:hypothetical protein
MDDDGEDIVPTPEARDRQSHVIGERMATVETKVTNIQDDLRRIGVHIHSISNAVTRTGYIEEKCLEGIKVLNEVAERFDKRLETLVREQMQRQGMGAFVQRFCLIVGAGAALTAIFAYMASHIGLKP